MHACILKHACMRACCWPWCHTVAQVQSQQKGAERHLVFPTHYCSCHSFQHSVVFKQEAAAVGGVGWGGRGRLQPNASLCTPLLVCRGCWLCGRLWYCAASHALPSIHSPRASPHTRRTCSAGSHLCAWKLELASGCASMLPSAACRHFNRLPCPCPCPCCSASTSWPRAWRMPRSARAC